jgi:hypothetical protein
VQGLICGGGILALVCCSAACLDAIKAACVVSMLPGQTLRPGAQAAEPAPAPPPPRSRPSAATRRWAERTASRACAWCCREIAEDEAIIGLFTTFRGPRQGRRLGWISVDVGGRRIHGRVAPPGSPAALEGAEIGFKVCSESCAAALTQAVREDELQSTRH